MELLLRLSSVLPREIVSSAFFLIYPPSERDILNACGNGKNLVLEQWFLYGLVDISIKHLLPCAADNGHTKVVSLLLAHGVSASCCENLPLYWAARNGHTEVVSLLLDHGAEPWHHDLYWAKRNGHSEIVSLLLRKRV